MKTKHVFLYWMVLRLYSPSETWYEGKWRPGEIELVK
jgi:hypothetical protein